MQDRRGQITRILKAQQSPDAGVPAELLPLVYEELRALARARMAQVPPGNTLQPTALVHESFVRLSCSNNVDFNSRGHFFAAAAEAMRQILVEQTRRKKSLKRGGDRDRVGLDDQAFALTEPRDDLLKLDAALDQLEERDPEKARIVKLRYFAGFSRDEAADLLGMSVRSLDRHWRFAIAKLHQLMAEDTQHG